MVEQNLLNRLNVQMSARLGGMKVLQHKRDMSTSNLAATKEFYCSQMNVQRKQLLLELNGNAYCVQAGAMQWMSSDVKMDSGVKGVGDFIGKAFGAAVTKESTAKPVYSGNGELMLEPTYRHILLTDIEEWGGQIVLDDGLFLACNAALQQKVVARSNISSAVFGKEGLFNLSIIGKKGEIALESIVPKEELIEINLQNDVMKIDGNMAIAWSGSLEFTVEKSAKSLIGSALSGEGLVNVYRGTGKIWMAPVMAGAYSAGVTVPAETAAQGQTGTKAGKVGIGDAVDAVSGVLNLFK